MRVRRAGLGAERDEEAGDAARTRPSGAMLPPAVTKNSKPLGLDLDEEAAVDVHDAPSLVCGFLIVRPPTICDGERERLELVRAGLAADEQHLVGSPSTSSASSSR